MQKYLSDKRIFWISVIIAVGGLVLPAFIFHEAPEPVQILGNYLKVLLEVIRLSFFESEIFSIEIPYKEEGTFLRYSLLNAFFYVLLLIGAILYIARKRRESRLLRFIFSVIFLSKIISILIIIFSSFAYLKASQEAVYIYIFFNFAIAVFHVYLAFSILKFLSNEKVLDSSIREYGDRQSIMLIEASKWTRFFHHITDTLMMFL
ncbi:MAG TPA: hypothetical protein VFR70_03605, partial [Flavobacterium sp.]|nr:hypothetical protein [Flavobacterium sp.]